MNDRNDRMADNQKKRSIYKQFSQSPLKPSESELYVDLDEVRGGSGAMGRMEERIRLSTGATCQVLAGHRGSGKSTELLRLQKRLEEPEAGVPPFFVVRVEGTHALDPHDVDVPDVVFAVVHAVAKDLRARLGIELRPGYFRDRWEQLKNLLGSDVSVKGLDLAGIVGKLSLVVKSSPETRQKIREALEPDMGNLVEGANSIFAEAVHALGSPAGRKTGASEKTYQGLVVIVDDLDKMSTRTVSSADCTMSEYLFVNRAAQLTALTCHVIYTMPIELAYSHHGPRLKTLYGGQIPVIPMTKIATRPPKPKPFLPGIRKLRDMVLRRLEHVKATERDAFADRKVLDGIIRLSGGQPNELMRLVRNAIEAADFPLGESGLRRAKVEAQREFLRVLRPDHWELIDEVRQTGSVVLTSEKKEKAFRELLGNGAILCYVNDDEWYAVHPALDGVPPPILPPNARDGHESDR